MNVGQNRKYLQKVEMNAGLQHAGSDPDFLTEESNGARVVNLYCLSFVVQVQC